MAAAVPPVDDTRHSLLRKARPLSQVALDAFVDACNRTGRSLPRDVFGHYTVREVEVKQALTACRLPNEPWSLNPYVGCSHACAYCYVPDVAHVERERWGSYVVVKRNLPAVLARELKRKPRKDVFLSSATDPYQPAEATHRITGRCVALLARADWPLRVLTRNPLVRRDIPLFREFSDFGVGMSVPTLDDEARRIVEPGAPPVEGRLRALRDLADAGFSPFVNLAPCYPLTDGVKPDDLAEALREAGVSSVYAARWRYLKGVLPALRAHVAGTALEASFAEAVQDPRYYRRLFAAIRGACRRVGLPFRPMW